MKNLISTGLAGMLLSFAADGYAAPVVVNVSGTVHTASGTMSDFMGQAVNATFLFDLNGSAASSVDTDDSDNPLETFTAIYSFDGGSYSWSATVSGNPDSVGSTDLSVLTGNDVTDPLFNGGNPFDFIEIWGSDVTPFCPPDILSTKGYCDATDYNPGTGVEVGFDIGMTSDWFNGTDLPTYIPALANLPYAGLWASDYVDGSEVGTIEASVTSMTVSSVPVPAAAWLFASGLVGLVGVARRKKDIVNPQIVDRSK